MMKLINKLSTSNERLKCLEVEAKTATVERKALSCMLKDSSTLLKTLLCALNNNKQYVQIENLLLKGLKWVPTWLKGYAFCVWVADLLNRLIPNLDFVIRAHHPTVFL